MTSAAWRSGFTRVFRAPAIVVGMLALTMAAALPAAIVLRGMIGAHLGRSVMGDAAAEAVNYDWWQEFTSQASGLATTFSPAIIGFAATLDNLSTVLDGRTKIAAIGALLAVYMVAWIFLSGGIVDRLARQRSTRAFAFFGACGVFFWRFLRLAIVAGVVYWFLFSYVHPWLLEDAYRRLTRDLAVERNAFFWRIALYASFGACVIAANLVFDYARIRLVVEDRRSALGAIRAALAFIGRHPRTTTGLYALNALTFIVLIAVWAVAAPGAGPTGAMMWVGFLVAQLYLLARVVLKLQFIASQTALFQASLAHAAYAAAPAREWPDSPAVEAVAGVSSTTLR
jgi:hypothetical protein